MALERVGLGAFLEADPTKMVDAMGRARDSMGRFVKTTDQIPSKMGRIGSAVSTAMASIQRSISGVSRGLNQIGGALRSASFATAPLTLAVGAGVKQAAEFEKQMDAVSSITRASAEDMGRLEAKAKEMGIVSVFSATESAQAMEFMARSGANTTQIIDGLQGVMAAAAAESIDLATASDIVAQTTKIMGREWEDASNTADILALTSMSTNTNMVALGEALRFGGQSAANMGFTLEETAATMGLLADAGLRGSIGGTSLTNMFNKLNKPSEKASELMKKWRIRLTRADGSMRSISEITQQFSARINKIPNAAKRAAATTEIFGIRGQRAFQALSKAGKESADKLVAAMFDASAGIGAAQEASEKRLDNFLGSLTLFRSSVESLSIGLFGPFLKQGQTALEGITNSLNNVLFSLTSLQDVRKKEQTENAKSTKLLVDMGQQRLENAGIQGIEALKARKLLAVLALQDVAGKKLTQADKERRQEAIDGIEGILKANARLSDSVAKDARAEIVAGIGAEAALLRQGDALRAQIFQIEELQRIEQKHGKVAVAIAKGIQSAIDTLKDAWDTIVARVTALGDRMTKVLGPDTVSKIAKFATIFTLVAAAAGPILIVLALMGFVITSVVIPAIAGILTIASAVFVPVLVLLGALFLAFSLLRQGNESWFQTAKRVFGDVKAFVLDLWQNVLRPMWLGIKDAFIPIVEELGVVWQTIVGEIKLALNDMFGVFSQGTEGISVNWREVGRTVANVIGTIIFVILKLMSFAIPIFAFLIKMMFTWGSVIWDFVVAPFRFLFTLVGNIGTAFGKIFGGELLEGLGRLGVAILDFVLVPLQLVIRTAIKLADAVGAGSKISKGVRTFAEEGLTGLVFPEPPEARKSVDIVARGAQKQGEELAAKQPQPTTPEDQKRALEKQLEAEMDIKTQLEAAAKAEKQELKADIKIEDKRTLEIENKLCVDGDELNIAAGRSKVELQERAGFKATPWQRRITLEQGDAPRKGAA